MRLRSQFVWTRAGRWAKGATLNGVVFLRDRFTNVSALLLANYGQGVGGA